MNAVHMHRLGKTGLGWSNYKYPSTQFSSAPLYILSKHARPSLCMSDLSMLTQSPTVDPIDGLKCPFCRKNSVRAQPPPVRTAPL